MWGEPNLAAALLCYGAAWLIANALFVWRPSALRLPTSRLAGALLAVLLTAAPVTRLSESADEIATEESAEGLAHYVESRLRLAVTPSIAPALVASDRPQTFYVQAASGERATVDFGAGPLATEALGEGLFRLEYDPRRDGLPSPTDGALEATITVDGHDASRSMRAVAPLHHPRELRASPDGARAVAVSEETDTLFVLDADGLRATHDVGDGPSDACFDGRALIVSHRYESTLRWLDADNGEATDALEVGPFARSVDARSGRIALARGGSSPELLLIERRQVQQRIALTAAPDRVRFGRSRDEVVVSVRRGARLRRFARPSAGTEDAPDSWRDLEEDGAPIELGRPAVTFATRADDARLVVAVTDLQTDGEPHLGNHFVVDQLVTVDLARWAISERRATARRTPRQDRPGAVDRGVSPSAIQLVDGGLWVAFAGSDDLWWWPDGAPPAIVELDRHPLAAPLGLAALDDGTLLVSSGVYGAFGRFDARREHVENHRVTPGDRELLANGRDRRLQRRIGERTFYETTRAGVSCQSCHLHGESDLGAHNIGGKTLVATLDVRGLLGTPPYLRDGGYPRLGSLTELSRTLYGGFRRDQGGRTLSLDVYLEDLPRAPVRAQLEGPRDLARERRGYAAFREARCGLCHAPPAFTNLGQHPVAALFPRFAERHSDHSLDTPSLLGLASSAPYLLDGRAQTLASIFEDHDPARRHGRYHALSETERADLLHFLEGL